MLFNNSKGKLAYIFFFTTLFLLTSCASLPPSKTPSLKLQLLDEYIIPADSQLENTVIGGLSGIQQNNNAYYLISDDPKTPRIYKTHLFTSVKQIDSLSFNEVILLDKNNPLLSKTFLDTEDLIIHPTNNEFIIVSEGSIDNKKNPSIIKFNEKGKFVSKYKISSHFTVNSTSRPRNNGVFEAITVSTDKKGFWVANELPLKADGPKPKLYQTKSPVRFTYYDFENTKPQQQFSYPLGRIKKIPNIPFSLNGLTSIMALAKNRFLVLERAFSAGKGKKSHRVVIYEYVLLHNTNTLEKESLRKLRKQHVEKNLVLDLDDIRDQLPSKSIDNLEGFCYGPTLENGNKTLLLIADNNFNSFMPQLNQLLWFEIINK